jgi:Domain of unknown function (DUF892)
MSIEIGPEDPERSLEHDSVVLDAALIGLAQRVEHYEMAGYGTVIALAEELGESKHVSLLKETLEEEKETDKKLTELAGDINAQANKGEEAEAEESPPEDKEKISQRGVKCQCLTLCDEDAVATVPQGTAFILLPGSKRLNSGSTLGRLRRPRLCGGV